MNSATNIRKHKGGGDGIDALVAFQRAEREKNVSID